MMQQWSHTRWNYNNMMLFTDVYSMKIYNAIIEKITLKVYNILLKIAMKIYNTLKDSFTKYMMQH